MVPVGPLVIADEIDHSPRGARRTHLDQRTHLALVLTGVDEHDVSGRCLADTHVPMVAPLVVLSAQHRLR
jgi:hypothetical protein